MTIGVYCGSFDPVHTGHIALASRIASDPSVDQVWLLVSRRNPLKVIPTIASDADRLAMARIATCKTPGVEVSDFEMGLPSPSYTYTTLCSLREAYPQHSFRLIIGSDNWANFPKWKNFDRILSEFGLIIYPRPGYPVVQPLPDNVILLDNVPQSPASSTLVRDILSRGDMPTSGLLDPAVADYIYSHQLYSPFNTSNR